MAAEYAKVMEGCKVTLSKEKSLVSHTGAMEFAKRFITDMGQWDFSPVSVRKLRCLHTSIGASLFSELGVDLKTSYRLKGASYRVYTHLGVPEKARRWRRHWLLQHSPTGIHPYPLAFWLVLPDAGVVDCYKLGFLRHWLLERLHPKDFDEKKFRRLETFWVNDEDSFFERLFQEWLKQHLDYLRWYWLAYCDYGLSLEYLLAAPVVCYSYERRSNEKLVLRYGFMFRMYDLCRTTPNIKPLGVGRFSWGVVT